MRPARPQDEPGWRVLWRDYCRFYGADVPAAVTTETWRRCLDPAVPALRCLVAELPAADGPVLAGFATLLAHPGTWSIAPVGYLEDLYVAPAARRRGVGRALIEACATLGREAGWVRLYWRTCAGNTPARALYDRLGERTDWVIYDRPLQESV